MRHLTFLVYLSVLSNAIELNQTVLFDLFGYSAESVYIDLERESIDIINLSTFNGLQYLEELHLQDNKIKRIEKDHFKDLIHLRELWLESNTIISIDKDAFSGLNNLELVCLNDNPIVELFANQLDTLCDSNPKCVIKITEKCQRKLTSRASTLKTSDRFDEFLNIFQLEQQKQDEKILSLETNLKINNQTLNKILDKQEKFEDKIDQMLQLLNKKMDALSNQINSCIPIKPEYSLAHNISIEKMKSQGYKIVYDYLYSHLTTMTELNAIKGQCSSQTILCAGGAAVNSNTLLLVSCGNCREVLTPTSPFILNNGAYWYLENQNAFGFSPSNNIKLVGTDIYDCDSSFKNCKDNNRLSFNLGGSTLGGWRLGKLTGHDPSSSWFSSYRKLILII